MAKKSWAEKFSEVPVSKPKMTDKGMMYISTPKEIMKYIKKVPKGKLTTSKQIAEKLTKKYGVDFTCPLTTGIFISVITNYVEELKLQGKDLKTPWWRVIKEGGKLYPKYLGELHPQKELLKDEGFKISKGRAKDSLVVENWKDYLV